MNKQKVGVVQTFASITYFEIFIMLSICSKMCIDLQTSASIQPRASPGKFVVWLGLASPDLGWTFVLDAQAGRGVDCVRYDH